MAEIAEVLLSITKGDLDSHLGDIAEALALRQSDLRDHQLAATVMAAYADLTGLGIEEVLESLKQED